MVMIFFPVRFFEKVLLHERNTLNVADTYGHNPLEVIRPSDKMAVFPNMIW